MECVHGMYDPKEDMTYCLLFVAKFKSNISWMSLNCDYREDEKDGAHLYVSY